MTPGSVAAAALGPGDEFLKVGNVVTSDLPHNDAMELVKQAGNILQLTIRKWVHHLGQLWRACAQNTLQYHIISDRPGVNLKLS